MEPNDTKELLKLCLNIILRMKEFYYVILTIFLLWLFFTIKPIASSITQVFENHHWDATDLVKSAIKELKAPMDE